MPEEVISVESKSAIFTDGETAGDYGTGLWRTVKLELEVVGDVTGATVPVLQDAILEGHGEGIRLLASVWNVMSASLGIVVLDLSITDLGNWGLILSIAGLSIARLSITAVASAVLDLTIRNLVDWGLAIARSSTVLVSRVISSLALISVIFAATILDLAIGNLVDRIIAACLQSVTALYLAVRDLMNRWLSVTRSSAVLVSRAIASLALISVAVTTTVLDLAVGNLADWRLASSVTGGA